MMRATSRLMMIAAVILAVFGFVGTQAAGAAPVQTAACASDNGGDYPPSGGSSALEASLKLSAVNLKPGTTGTLTFTGGQPNTSYCTDVFSNVTLTGNGVADGAGNVVFTFDVPSNFEAPGLHHVDVYSDAGLAFAGDFCIDADGALTSCPDTPTDGGSGNLPRTGADNIRLEMQLGAAAIALGAGLVYWQRRKTAEQA